MSTLATDECARHPAAPLWRTPGLGALFLASTSARLANEAARVAVVLLVLSRTDSPALAGAVVAALTLPQLVSGPFLGAWLDRTHHRRTAFVANQVLLPVVLVGLLAATGHSGSWVVVMLGALAGLTAPVLTGGFTGLIAPLVHGDLLRRAYGAESTSYNVAGVVGPALAGALAGWVSSEAAVVVAAGLSVVALAAVLRVPMPMPLAASTAPLARSVWEGLQHLARTPRLRAVTVMTTFSFGGIGAFPVVFPSLAKALGSPEAASGALFSAFAVGALVGSLAVSARTPKTGPFRSALLGVSGLALVFAALAKTPSMAVAVMLVALAGMCEGPVVAATLTIREQMSPASMRTQVVTTAASIKFGAYALGSALAGHLVASSGVRAGVWFLASCQLSGVLLGLVALRGRARAIA
ncbi:MAG: MFS transporter [Actinomycetota bacterium]|nr:MFS transporter [Actinomycetota bacterium]